MSTENNTPSIKPTQDGPYLVKFVEQCRNQAGPIETSETMAFCRCGASQKKPFCDGSHKKIGFSSAKLDGRTENKRQSYVGKQITIHDNRGLCSHAGYCTDNLASVFRMKQEPWIDPDAATVDEVVATIALCPSGALSYSIDETEMPRGDGVAAVEVSPNGPYVVTGNVELIDTEWGDGALRHCFALCRCGASKNKPFCDGSHWDIGFSDDKN